MGDAPRAGKRLLDTGTNPIWNAFPIRFYEPGTEVVANPGAVPAVSIPGIATPPLPITP